MSCPSGTRRVEDPEMAWTPCSTCSRFRFDYRVPLDDLCLHCQGERRKYLARRLRDRSYRAHLARRALGINVCDVQSGCPEQPPGHCILNISSIPGDGEFRRNDILKAYGILITEVSDMMMRRDRWSVSALEIIVSNLDVQHRVKFCETCLQTAIRQNQYLPQAQVRLCDVCLTRRDQHILAVHARQDSFHEPWEHDVTRLPVCRHEHDPIQCPDDFDLAIEKISGRRWGLKGGVDWADVGTKIGMGVLGCFTAYVLHWNASINDRNSRTARDALEETKRKNAFDEVIAMQNGEIARQKLELDKQKIEMDRNADLRAEEKYSSENTGDDIAVAHRFIRHMVAQGNLPPSEMPAFVALKLERKQCLPVQKSPPQAEPPKATLSNVVGSMSTQSSPLPQASTASPVNRFDSRNVDSEQQRPPPDVTSPQPAYNGTYQPVSALPAAPANVARVTLAGSAVPTTSTPRGHNLRASDLEWGMSTLDVGNSPAFSNKFGVTSPAPASSRSRSAQTSSRDPRASNTGRSTARPINTARPQGPDIPMSPLLQSSAPQAYSPRVQSMVTPGQSQPVAGYSSSGQNVSPVPGQSNAGGTSGTSPR